MFQRKSRKSFETSYKIRNRSSRIGFRFTKTVFRRYLPIILVLFAVVLGNKLFIIKKINCSLNNESCPVIIQAIAEKLIGSSSVLLNQKNLLSSINKQYPIDKIDTNFRFFNTLNIHLSNTNSYLSANIYLVNSLPVLSIDNAPSSTDSAGWWVKPTEELDDFILSSEALSFNIYSNGSMIPTASSSGSNIHYIFSTKPSQENLSSIYQLLKLVLKHLSITKIYIVNNRCFLSQPGQPDIIVSVPFDEVALRQGLQSINYLNAIKKDTRVIDLSFKNPIIK